MSILAAAADVLRCFSNARHHVTVTDLGTLLGMPKSNASRLLRAMKDEGLLETVGDSKRYRPSSLLCQVGGLYRFAASLIDRASASVARVSDEVGHSGYVSVRRGADIIGVTSHAGRNSLRVVTAIGDRLPAHASSTGRALLARRPDADVRALYPRGFEPASATAPQNVAELLERLDRVRRTGFAEAHDEAVPGVGALSVAVGDAATGDEVALCITFPAATVDAAERAGIVSALGGEAAGIAALVRDDRFIPLSLPSEIA